MESTRTDVTMWHQNKKNRNANINTIASSISLKQLLFLYLPSLKCTEH